MHKRVPGLLDVDAINVVLIVISCALAHVAPYWLLAFSYAILGPAHYLTQISWLHDRKYFATSTYVTPVMVTISCLLVLPLVLGVRVPDPGFTALLLCVAVSVGAAMGVSRRRGLAAGVLTALVLVALALRFRALALFIALLLPTVMHIFVFTAAFMLHGARRTRSIAGYVAVFALIACAATFWIPVGAMSHVSASHATVTEFFQPVVAELGRIGLGVAPAQRLFGFLAFAYTYHYLNWFSKVNVIRWNDVPRVRRYSIATIYVLLLAAYACSFLVGFTLSLLLSVLHVLLEFPLNVRTFSALSGNIARPRAASVGRGADSSSLASPPGRDTLKQ